jgi:hypothetical protein
MVDVYTFARLALNALSEPPLPKGIRFKVELDPDLNEVSIRAYWTDAAFGAGGERMMRTALLRWCDGHRCSVAEGIDSLRADIAQQLLDHGAPHVRS